MLALSKFTGGVMALAPLIVFIIVMIVAWGGHSPWKGDDCTCIQRRCNKRRKAHQQRDMYWGS